MKNQVVIVPAIAKPIAVSPGFAKKLLSQFKLDLMALCGFGCRYCSSNAGNYLRIHREQLADETERQLGVRLYPDTDPSLTIHWGDVFEKIEKQLGSKPRTWGQGQTIVFSMLTDGFSPLLVESGQTRLALEWLVDRTSFRIRVLTKNAVVGSPEWIEFFLQHPDRFVVGLSTGTVDDRSASRIELGTPWPSKRLAALRNLQDAGVPTYGMLCPVMPDVLDGNGAGLEQLVAAISPERVECVWAEPYNNRHNWQAVQLGYQPGSASHSWFQSVFGERNWSMWSRYATELYTRLHAAASRDGWTEKLRHLLYELRITGEDASVFEHTGLDGVLLQTKPNSDGASKNPSFARMQQSMRSVEATSTATPSV